MGAVSRRALLLAAAAAGIARGSASAAVDAVPATPALRAIAASRGLLYGSYLDYEDLQAQPDYAVLAARDCGVMVSSRMDWDHLQPTALRHEFSGVDVDYEWARAHDMRYSGHALVWGERAPA